MKLDLKTRERLKLTRDERKAVYRGVRKLVRAEKPEVEAGETLIVAWTRGGRYVIDRETGDTAERARRPTVWLRFEEPEEVARGWQLRYEIHDERESTRLLAASPGGQREAGMRTRWRPAHQVPTKAKQRRRIEAEFGPETERGYTSGGNNIEPAEGVDDETLAQLAVEARERWEQEHPEETKAEKLRRLQNKARRLQREAEKVGVDLSADLTLFNTKAREAIVAAKAREMASEPT